MTRYTSRALRTQLLALLLLGTACSLDEGGGPSSDLDAGPTLDQSVPDDTSAQSDVASGLDATADVPVDAPAPPPDAACDPSACLGERCLAGVCSFYASCNEMHQADSLRKTGAHKLHDLKQATYDAWCDMDLDGGGWTLVGRAVLLSGSSSSFGWKKATGSVANDLAPYSLDVDAHGLVFTEVVVGTYSLGKAWFGSAYKATLPANFLASYKGTATGVTVSKIGGACLETSPSMLTNMGYVDDNNHFFLRDKTDAGDFGLRADGFALNYNDCPNAALMNLAPGMIAVR